MSEPGNAPPSRGKVALAVALLAVAGAVLAWRLSGRSDAQPKVEASVEDHSVKLKQELMLLEQQQNTQPEPEPATPVEPTRAARSVK